MLRRPPGRAGGVEVRPPGAATLPMRFAHFQFDPETDRLGEGPLSEVYRAKDVHLDRTVALKILRPHAEIDPQADKRFLREAKHTSNLDHPNIATIYEYGQDKGTWFIAMEFLQGRTLDKVIKKKALGYEEGMRIARQVTDALAKVHQNDLIHRDLKPANILLQDDGSVKLLDFGIARARDESGITQHGMLVGTVLYMSPEQVRGEDLDFRSDIFSLGAVLYHLMTGELPFPGESFPEVCMAILDSHPRRPSEVRKGFPPGIETFLVRCLEGNPDDRYTDAASAHAALVQISESLSGTAGHATPALRGTILLAPLRCAGPVPDACSIMAGGVLKDLASELNRNKGVEALIMHAEEPAPEDSYDYILRGTLDVDGPKGELSLELEVFEDEGATGKPSEIYSDRFKHSDEDEWTLQADLVRSAVRAVRKRLTQSSLRPGTRSQRKVEEAKRVARDAYLMMHRGTTKHLLGAVARFRQSLDHDRYCALAHAGLAEAMVRKYLYWDGDTSFLDEGREFAGRALALDASCAEAHTALGYAAQMSGRMADAQREYDLAIRMDNSEWMSHRLLGAVLAKEGNFKKASPLLRQAISLRPQHIPSYDRLFTVLRRLDRYREALEVGDDGITAAGEHLRDVPDDQSARLHMAMLLARLERNREARTQVEEARRRSGKDGYTAFHSATVFALMGELGEAMESLTLAQARGYYIRHELVRNQDFDVLRGLQTFKELIG